MTPLTTAPPKNINRATILTMESRNFPAFTIGFRANNSVKAVEKSRAQYEALYELISIELGDGGGKKLVWERRTPLIQVSIA